MREPMSEINNTIKHRHLNQTRITRTRKWIYLKIIGIKMIVLTPPYFNIHCVP